MNPKNYPIHLSEYQLVTAILTRRARQVGARFRKRIKLFDGLYLNLSKSGPASLSIGGPGAVVNIGRQRSSWSVGVPGTGLSYRKYISASGSTKKKRKGRGGSGPSRSGSGPGNGGGCGKNKESREQREQRKLTENFLSLKSSIEIQDRFDLQFERYKSAILDEYIEAEFERHTSNFKQLKESLSEMYYVPQTKDLFDSEEDNRSLREAIKSKNGVFSISVPENKVAPSIPLATFDSDVRAIKIPLEPLGITKKADAIVLTQEAYFGLFGVFALSAMGTHYFISDSQILTAFLGLIGFFYANLAGTRQRRIGTRDVVEYEIARKEIERLVERNLPEAKEKTISAKLKGEMDEFRKRLIETEDYRDFSEALDNHKKALMAGNHEDATAYLAHALTESTIPWLKREDCSPEIAFPDDKKLLINLDLPEIENIIYEHSLTATGKVSVNARSAKAINQDYFESIVSYCFYICGVAFSALPFVDQIRLAGYTQRLDETNGQERDQYVIAFQVSRNEFAALNWKKVDPLKTLQSLGDSASYSVDKRTFHLNELDLSEEGFEDVAEKIETGTDEAQLKSVG